MLEGPKYYLIILLTMILLPGIFIIGVWVKDQPSLSDRINQGVEMCLDTVGFWPCSLRHKNIVKEKICPVIK